MTETEKPKVQQTQPKKGEPVEVPVPKRKDVLADLAKVAKGEPDERPKS